MAASDANDARFWKPAELANSAGSYRELYSEPRVYRDLRRTVGRAQAALTGPNP
ncbi:hypothetical protein [Haladaptatus sp. NG-WS-4]